MPVFGRAGSGPSGVPKFLAPTPAPLSLTGDNYEQVATAETRVTFTRTTLYQAVAAPVFVPLVMGWFSALGTPTAKAALTAAVLASGGALPPTQPPAVETVTIDKWYRELDRPQAKRYTPPHNALAYVGADPFPETVSIDRWLRPLDVPQRPRPVADQLDTVLGVPPITIDWLRPLDVPQRPRPVAAQQATAYTGFPPFAAGTSNEWFQPLDQPTRAAVRPRPEWSSVYAPAAAAETVTVDKWYQNFSLLRQPGYTVSFSEAGFPVVEETADEDVTVDKWFRGFDQPGAKRYTPSHNALAYVGAAPFAETVSIDRWLRPLDIPTRAKPRLEGLVVHPPQETARGYQWYVPLNEPPKVNVRPKPEWTFTYNPPPPEVVTLDKWYAAFSEPVRVRIPVAFYQFFAADTTTPPPEVVTIDKWYASLSMPVRVPPAVAFQLPFTIDPVALTLPSPPPPPPDDSVGGSMSGGTFTKGQWRKLKDEWEREVLANLQAKAKKAKGDRRAAIQEAAEAVKDAIRVEAEIRDLLDGAMRAQATAEFYRVAEIIQARVEATEDEEDAMMVLFYE